MDRSIDYSWSPADLHHKEVAMRNRLLALSLLIAVSLPSLAADAPLEKLLVAVKKLNGKVEVEKIGKTDYLTIHLSDTAVKDADLEALSGMTQVRKLYLQNTGITDEGLKNLKGLENLQSLSLNKTKITDDGLANLAALTKLHTLSLSNTKITDKGLEHVKELSELKTLHLKGTKVTEDGIKDLKKTLTKVEIDH
jgi:internalin A